MTPAEIRVICRSGGCEKCAELQARIHELEHENERLILAIQREAHYMEPKRIHHKDQDITLRRYR